METRVFVEDARGRLMEIDRAVRLALADQRVRLASYLVAGVDLTTRRALLSSVSPLPTMFGVSS